MCQFQWVHSIQVSDGLTHKMLHQPNCRAGCRIPCLYKNCFNSCYFSSRWQPVQQELKGERGMCSFTFPAVLWVQMEVGELCTVFPHGYGMGWLVHVTQVIVGNQEAGHQVPDSSSVVQCHLLFLSCSSFSSLHCTIQNSNPGWGRGKGVAWGR